jgi:CDP-glucose 4,6-dehydratase
VTIDTAFWRGRRVLVTGHTGFVGGWLSGLLCELGAEVGGYALSPPTDPSFFEATGMADRLAASIIGDVRDGTGLAAAFQAIEPSIVFHLAAQPLVRRAQIEPQLTFETNVMGTVNVLQAVRDHAQTKAVLVMTTDKIYRNNNWVWPYRETDRIGGAEPYSASKAGTEFVVDAYRNVFLKPDSADGTGIGVASIRAGNIIGGGDWAAERLVPDAMRSFVEGRPVILRNPKATRPWQHVLDPLLGCLRLAENLASDPAAFSSGWNFGPAPDDSLPVRQLTEVLCEAWGGSAHFEIEESTAIFEERLLALDSSKAMAALAWRPRWRVSSAVRHTVDWYKAFYEGRDVWLLTREQYAEIIEGR